MWVIFFNPLIMVLIFLIPTRDYLYIICALSVQLLCYYCTDIAQIVHRWCTDNTTMALCKYGHNISLS
jgi:hypothetical protein